MSNIKEGMDRDNLNKDFSDFCKEDELKAPKSFQAHLFSTIKAELQPTTKSIFVKLFSVQAFVGIISLIFCPQFSFSLTNNNQVFHFFHKFFGYYACVSICAGLFMGLGALCAAQILTSEEIKKVKAAKVYYYLSISSLMVLSFFFLGAEVYLDIAGFWLLGALLGGLAMLKVGDLARLQFS